FSATAVADKPGYVRLFVPGSVEEFGSVAVDITSLDQFQNPSGGLSINLSAANGSSVQPTVVTTSSEGKSSATWTMPAAPATVTLTGVVSSTQYSTTISAAVVHAPPVRLLITPDTAYSIPMSFDSTGSAFYHADMRDPYDHSI